jgi:hypothetical protein
MDRLGWITLLTMAKRHTLGGSTELPALHHASTDSPL